MRRVRPATPNLDKMVAVKDKSDVVQDFIDWYCDEYLRTVNAIDLTDDSSESDREKVMAAYFGIDLKKAEEERMSLLQDIREDHKVQDTIKRKATVQ